MTHTDDVTRAPGPDAVRGPGTWPAPSPADWQHWVLNAAHLLELADEFFARSDEGVHMALGEFFAARGEHPIGAPDGYTDSLGFTAYAIRCLQSAGAA